MRSEKTTQPFGESFVVTSLKKTGTDATFFFAPVKAGTVGGGGDVEDECGPKLDGGNFVARRLNSASAHLSNVVLTGEPLGMEMGTI